MHNHLLMSESGATKRHQPPLSDYSKRKREQILQAAFDTFLELGYEGASMNLVAERAGVIKQTIYSHFKDKEGLFTSVISSITFERVQESFAKSIADQKTPEQVLRDFAKTLASRQFDPKLTKLLRTIIGESGRFPKLAQLYTNATIKPGIQTLTDYLRNHPEINLPDPEAFARIFAGSIINHCMQQNILHGKSILPFELERIVDELIRLFALSSKRRVSERSLE